MSTEEYTLLPLSLPGDGPSIMRLHYQVYLSRSPSSPVPESEWTTTGLPVQLSRFSTPGSLMYKLVPSADQEKLVAYIVFTPPSAPDLRTEQEVEADLRKKSKKSQSGLGEELMFRMMMEDRILNEKYFGLGHESKFWALETLVTDKGFQRRGLGSRLVKHGVRIIEEEKGEGVEGVKLIADEDGERTYLGAGFEKVGERRVDAGGRREVVHAWFLKKF